MNAQQEEAMLDLIEAVEPVAKALARGDAEAATDLVNTMSRRDLALCTIGLASMLQDKV